MIRAKQRSKRLTWLVLCLFMWTVSCTSAPPLAPLLSAQQKASLAVTSDTSKGGFKTKGLEDDLCLKQNWFDNGLSDSVYISVDLKYSDFLGGDWRTWSPQLDNAKFRIIPQEDGNYLLTQVEDHAYSGPYGYHLFLFPQPVVIQGPITPGKTVTVPFAPGATGSYYSFGSSSSTYFDITGSIDLSFDLDKITVSFNTTTGVMTESALQYTQSLRVM